MYQQQTSIRPSRLSQYQFIEIRGWKHILRISMNTKLKNSISNKTTYLHQHRQCYPDASKEAQALSKKGGWSPYSCAKKRLFQLTLIQYSRLFATLKYIWRCSLTKSHEKLTTTSFGVEGHYSLPNNFLSNKFINPAKQIEYQPKIAQLQKTGLCFKIR